MKRFYPFLILAMLLTGCDKAEEQMEISLPATSEDLSDGILIANNLGETLSILTPGGQIKNRIAYTGQAPNQILTDDEHIYIVNSLSNSIQVLNRTNLSPVKEISTGAKSNPWNAAIVAPGILAVSQFAAGALALIDINNGQILQSVDLNNVLLDQETNASLCSPTGVAVNGSRVYVTLGNLSNYQGGLTAAGHGMIAVLEYSDRKLELIDLDPLTPATDGIRIENGWNPVYAEQWGGQIIIACGGHYQGNINSINPGGFEGDGSIAILNPASNTIQNIALEGAAPFGFSISPDGVLHTSNALNSGIQRINMDSLMKLPAIPTSSLYTSGVLATADRVYALNFNDDTITTFDRGGNKIGIALTGDGPIAMVQTQTPEAEEIISFSAYPSRSVPKAEICFEAAGSGDYIWDFGDGNQASGNRVLHSYEQTGIYEVSLKLADSPVIRARKSIEIAASSPFAVHMIDWQPRPGQFVGNTQFNNPYKALGAPVGGGNFAPNNSSIVTLGGFEGSITLAFDHEVVDRPGFDFIVYGNAFNGSQEPGRVEISLDGVSWFDCPGAFADTTATMQLGDDDPEIFYTQPDDPATPEIEGGGGDAFDIAWAKQHNGPDSIRFVRITTAQDIDNGTLGELSTEIDAVAEVRLN